MAMIFQLQIKTKAKKLSVEQAVFSLVKRDATVSKIRLINQADFLG
jgi:hypothetical protein